jgi:ribosomal protein S18 acetylase RimI-like enzyme
LAILSREYGRSTAKSGVAICSAGANDFDQICELYRRSIGRNPHGFIQDLTFHGCLTEKISTWRKAGGDFLVAIGRDKVVGIGGLAPQTARSAELCKLHVDPRWQRRGIGRLIAIELVESARRAGFSEIELHVTVTQAAAVALYRRLGFRETSRKLFTTVVFGAVVSFDTIYMTFII